MAQGIKTRPLLATSIAEFLADPKRYPHQMLFLDGGGQIPENLDLIRVSLDGLGLEVLDFLTRDELVAMIRPVAGKGEA